MLEPEPARLIAKPLYAKAIVRTRTLALTMNTVERVAELFSGGRELLPSSQKCPEVIETYKSLFTIIGEQGIF